MFAGEEGPDVQAISIDRALQKSQLNILLEKEDTEYKRSAEKNLIVPMSIITVRYEGHIWEAYSIITSYLEMEWVGSFSSSRMESGEVVNYRAL